MINSRVGIAAIGLLIAIQAPTVGTAAEGPLQLGVAVVDITPPIGYRMSGYFYERPSTGVLNPLHAKALVIAQGDVRFAWVFCDLIGTPSQLTSRVRDAAAAATGIPRDGVVVAATHSHTGPLYFGALRDYFHRAAKARTGDDPHEAAVYPAQLAEKLLSVIRDAAANTIPVALHAGVAEQPGLAFNRRYLMRDGSVKTNPGKRNPDVLRPAGPTDPEAGLLQFRRAGNPVAGLTVFALHCDTTGGTEFAADYPYFLEREIRQRLGAEYVSAFAAGTCGDVNHLDLSHDRPQKGADESERIGSALAATAIRALDELPLVERPDLASASKTVAVALQRYSPQEVARARANLAKVGTRELPGIEQVAAVKIVGIADYETEALPMEVQAFRLSKETALVALPGELFAELGLAIKRQSPFATTLVVELCNDYPGYIPTRRGFAEGGYEPTNSKVEPGGGELLVDTAVQLLHAVKAK